jgi:hypothetical protein
MMSTLPDELCSVDVNVEKNVNHSTPDYFELNLTPPLTVAAQCPRINAIRTVRVCFLTTIQLRETLIS